MPRKKRTEGTRAPNMTASIYQGSDGRWHGRVTLCVKGRLQPEHIEKLYAAMRAKGLKTGTVHHTHRTLRAALNEAIRRGQIVRNPVLVAKPPRLEEEEEEEIEPFTVKEAKRILAVAAQRPNDVRFAVALANRPTPGEALGRQNADEKASTLTIRRAMQRHNL